MNKITIQDLLRGTYIGKLQSVGYMQVIPLLSEYSNDKYGCPSELNFRTTDYGTMGFNNKTNKPIIVPCHASYIVDKAAQNHAMAHSGIINKMSSKKYNTACCIQQSQSGTIPEGKYDMMILPYSLREIAITKRDERSYNKLWEDISTFNRSFNLQHRGHLEYFFNHFKKDLDEFIAEFELVDNQIGAIILINGEVVGIEKAPSHEYWESIFNPLIRDCYGSKALELNFTNEKINFSNVPIDSNNVVDLNSLIEQYEKATTKEEENVKDVIRKLVNEPFTKDVGETSSELDIKTITIENPQFTGQIVQEAAEIVYMSIVTKKDFFRNANWYKREEFSL